MGEGPLKTLFWDFGGCRLGKMPVALFQIPMTWQEIPLISLVMVSSLGREWQREALLPPLPPFFNLLFLLHVPALVNYSHEYRFSKSTSPGGTKVHILVGPLEGKEYSR